ncbi:MAG: rRNA maturation RNase YbeY [Bacteroidetes bacterium]|nr:rRNA maturation RNase YbeY [Bacteroidota bacterium]
MNKKSPIHFFKEDVSFRLLKQEELKKWILLAFKKNETTVIDINFIFCSDKYLLKLNKEYLGHNYFTDIITFDNSKENGIVEADIFISSERVMANAKKFKTGFRDELHRVMIHGALHLMGYDDKTAKAEKAMRQAEEYWLSKRNF